MLKIDLNLNKNVRFTSKKFMKKLAAVGLVVVVRTGQSLACAQELPPPNDNETYTNINDLAAFDDNTAIIKVMREELDGWEGYSRNFLAMLSDNEIMNLYMEELRQAGTVTSWE